mmetsp:Transcript_21223/g.29424  ORF Transcript_21223/g.29424 Transcript_21223/m.29424 type:complete len:182 (+) Transcript_21223:118-663(+)
MYPCFVPNETPIPKLVVVRFSNELQSVLLAMMHMVNTLFHLQDYLVMGKVGNVDLKMFGRLLSAQHSDASIKGYAANSVRGASSDEYRFVASFNQHSGRFSAASMGPAEAGLSYWDKVGRPEDKAGRQLSAFIDLKDLERNREEHAAKRQQQHFQRAAYEAWRQRAGDQTKKRKQGWLYED